MSVHPHRSVVGSVIHDTPSTSNDPAGSLSDDTISDEEAKRRREILARRPSYRKILNDLEQADGVLKREPDDDDRHPGHHDGGRGNGLPSSNHPRSMFDPGVLPTSLIPVSSSFCSVLPPGLSNGDGRLGMGPPPSALLAAAVSAQQQHGVVSPLTISAANYHHHQHPSAVAVAAAVSAAVSSSAGGGGMSLGNDLLGLKPVVGVDNNHHHLSSVSPAGSATGHYMTDFPTMMGSGAGSGGSSSTVGGGGGGGGVGGGLSGYPMSPDSSPGGPAGPSGGGGGGHGDVTQKRQLRLLKNREAAKECRRKKKEYVKCLENRVAVLENQNKALIEELKTLKELYCRKEKND